jgi:hypothetical protein
VGENLCYDVGSRRDAIIILNRGGIGLVDPSTDVSIQT